MNPNDRVRAQRNQIKCVNRGERPDIADKVVRQREEISWMARRTAGKVSVDEQHSQVGAAAAIFIIKRIQH